MDHDSPAPEFKDIKLDGTAKQEKGNIAKYFDNNCKTTNLGLRIFDHCYGISGRKLRVWEGR